MKKKEPMQWEVKKMESGKWGIFLQQRFCRTDQPVCYSASVSKPVAEAAVIGAEAGIIGAGCATGIC